MDDQSMLSPPQPKDKEGIRPPLNIAHVIRQVRGIQQFLADERTKTAKKSSDPLDNLFVKE